MNKFDEIFEFRLARYEEIDKIMEFIRIYWTRKNHILGVNRDFFEYEFCCKDRVGFYIALDKETGEIEAAEGVYYYSQIYIPGESDISGGMFLANPNCKVPLIGIELMKRKIEDLKPRSLVGPGVNLNTSGQLYTRRLKQDVSRMKHFYLLSDKDTYIVASIRNKKQSIVNTAENFELLLCKDAEELFQIFQPDDFKKRKPYKDKWYITKRYFEHPVYKYQVYAIQNKTALVFREIHEAGTKILRLIDVLGDTKTISGVGISLKKILKKGNYEYIDFYELGMEERDILNAGFVERLENDENIIPDYFAPFERCNVEIYVQRLDKDSLCFKGDGDQDRPNYI